MISILLPINGEGIEYIEESILSISNQTYGEWELLVGVYDNLINSDIYKIVKAYAKQHFIIEYPDINNKYIVLKKLLEKVKYKYVTVMNMGDIWLPKKLEIQYKYTSNYDVVGTLFKFKNKEKENENENENNIKKVGKITKKFIKEKNYIVRDSYMIKKTLLNLIDKEGEYKLWLLLNEKNKKFFNVHEPQFIVN